MTTKEFEIIPEVSGYNFLDDRDFDQAVFLIKRIWPDHAGIFREEVRVYRSSAALFNPHFAIAWHGDEMIGFGLLASSMMSTDLLIVAWLCVDEAHRGQRIGAQLMKTCMDEAVKRKKPVMLTTSAPEFYEKIGFKRVDQYNAPAHHFLMRYPSLQPAA